MKKIRKKLEQARGALGDFRELLEFGKETFREAKAEISKFIPSSPASQQEFSKVEYPSSPAPDPQEPENKIPQFWKYPHR